MLTPYSPLDFIEALAKERRDAIRADANRISIVQRLARSIAALSGLIRLRRHAEPSLKPEARSMTSAPPIPPAGRRDVRPSTENATP